MHIFYFSLYCTPAVIAFVVYNNLMFTKLGGKELTIFSISSRAVFFFFLKILYMVLSFCLSRTQVVAEDTRT